MSTTGSSDEIEKDKVFSPSDELTHIPRDFYFKKEAWTKDHTYEYF